MMVPGINNKNLVVYLASTHFSVFVGRQIDDFHEYNNNTKQIKNQHKMRNFDLSLTKIWNVGQIVFVVQSSE